MCTVYMCINRCLLNVVIIIIGNVCIAVALGGAVRSRDTCQRYWWCTFDCGFSKMPGEDSLRDLLDDAEALLNGSPEKAIVILERIAMAEVSPKAEEDVKCKEIATLKLGKVLAKNKMANGKQFTSTGIDRMW